MRGRCASLVLLLLGGGCALPGDKVAAPPPASDSVEPGGSLSVGITAPAGVDPLSFHEPSGLLIGSVLCDTLVSVDPETGRLQPGLAKKWTITDEGARIIFQLRKDVYFHDGRQLRSADVLESLKRLANPEFASYSAELMNGVLGLDQFRKDVDDGIPSPALTGVRVIEPFSFEIFLKPRHPDFLRVLAHPATAPVSKSPYDEGLPTAASQPACAGPYRLAAPYERGASEIVLDRFDRYYGQNPAFTAAGKGYADSIRFRIFPDEHAVFEAAKSGAVDVAGVPSPKVAEARAQFGARAITGDLPHAEFIALPHGEQSGFTDVRARIALSQAINREAIVASVYGGVHKPATGFIPPALRSEPPPRRGKGGVRSIDFDGCGEYAPLAGAPEEARRRWATTAASDTPAAPDPAAAAQPDPAAAGPIRLYYNDESNHGELAKAVASQWQEVLGVVVEPTPLAWEAFLQRGTVGPGFDGPFRISHAPRYASPQSFLGGLFLSGNTTRGNLARYASQPFDDAFHEDTRPVVDEHERLVRYRELEALLCGDMPIIPIAFGQQTTVFSERVIATRTSGRLLSRDGAPMLRDIAVTAR